MSALSKFNYSSIICNFELLSLVILNNIDYFFYVKGRHWYSEKFVVNLQFMLNCVHWYEPHIQRLRNSIQEFDPSENVLGNGYRSFSIIFDRLFSKCYMFLKELCAARESMFFTANSYLKQLESHSNMLEVLKPALTYILKMLEESGSSMPLDISNHVTAEEIVREYTLQGQTEFYGRCQGFYFGTSMRNILWGVSIIMASFSDAYQKSVGPLSRAFLSVVYIFKYLMDPDLRSRHIVNTAQNASVEFVKAFWSLNELDFMKKLPRWICPTLQVREELWIPASPVQIEAVDRSRVVIIPVPSSHIPSAPVRCLLLSSVHRRGQMVNGKVCNGIEPSPSLLLHCHGGGFVAQTPDSHEIYLRYWAHDLNIPILTVDYSLSPDAPFPRALEEVLLVYVWALKNCEKLGWTGERICFAGDSAGGNILMGVTIKTISMNIRQPDAILCAYTPLILDLVPSPSRLLTWLDPLLPLGFMISCLDAYVGTMQTDSREYTEERRSQSRERKLSSISEVLESSLMFLNDQEWEDMKLNESENSQFLDTSSLKDSQVHMRSSQIPNANYIGHYVNNFVDNYGSTVAHYSNENELDDDWDLLYDFPWDITHDIKQKLNNFKTYAIGEASRVIKKNKWCNMFISPFIPSHFLQHRIPKAAPLKRELSVTEKIKRLNVVSRNPYISPLLVTDEVLKVMPQVYFISLNFDPCLDDSITFAKRMAAVDNPVVMDVLDKLPHGFLNFLPFSSDAHSGSNTCVKRIKEALHLA